VSSIDSSPDRMGSGATLDARNDSKESLRQKLNSVLEPLSNTGGRSIKQVENLHELKDAIIELYLAIKIRSTEEVSFVYY